MDTQNPNFTIGLSLLSIGIAMLVVFGIWYLGVPFLLIGGHRLYVAYVESTNADDGADR